MAVRRVGPGDANGQGLPERAVAGDHTPGADARERDGVRGEGPVPQVPEAQRESFSGTFLGTRRGMGIVARNDAARDPAFEASLVAGAEAAGRSTVGAFNIRMRQTGGGARPEIGADGKPWPGK